MKYGIGFFKQYSPVGTKQCAWPDCDKQVESYPPRKKYCDFHAREAMKASRRRSVARIAKRKESKSR